MVFLFNLIWSLSKGKPAGSNPWRATTLEWQTPDTPPKHGNWGAKLPVVYRSEEHTSELQSQSNLVCRLLLEKTKQYRLAPPVRIAASRGPGVTMIAGAHQAC